MAVLTTLRSLKIQNIPSDAPVPRSEAFTVIIQAGIVFMPGNESGLLTGIRSISKDSRGPCCGAIFGIKVPFGDYPTATSVFTPSDIVACGVPANPVCRSWSALDLREMKTGEKITQAGWTTNERSPERPTKVRIGGGFVLDLIVIFLFGADALSGDVLKLEVCFLRNSVGRISRTLLRLLSRI